MQEYGAVFARAYDKRWTSFARTAAPAILDYYETSGTHPGPVLDLCCGTGQLSLYFLEHGYGVTGIDRSRDMLSMARRKAGPYVDSRQAMFIEGDAASFVIDRSFDLVVSTFDALNHLESVSRLASCFACVRRCLSDNGTFVFDLNTRLGLERWSSAFFQDDEELTFFNRGVYATGMDRAYNQITGFVRNDNGMYDKFDETFFNTAFDISRVTDLLGESGFTSAHAASLHALASPLTDPEGQLRVFMVANVS